MIPIPQQLQNELHIFSLTDSFITQCMNEIKRNPQSFNGSIEKMKEFVYNTYLNTDIRLTTTPTLPIFKFEDKEKTINFIILQCDEYNDISSSIDDQFKETKNRMMKLSLTDGKTQIYAIEKEHIHCLCMGIKPGFKIALRNVKVRRGIIYLYNRNIQLLGGEVEELVKLENERRTALERKYRPSYIPNNVKNHISIPLQNIDEDEENSDE